MQLDPQQLLSIWLKEREIQNQSKHTLQAYERDVSDFLNFCQRHALALGDIESTDLRQFMAEKVEQQGLSSSSLQRLLSAIRQFMKWAEQAQHVSFNPADDFQLKRQSRPLPGMVDIETIHQILDQPEPEGEVQQQMWKYKASELKILTSTVSCFALRVRGIKPVLCHLVPKPKTVSWRGYRFILYGMVILCQKHMSLSLRRVIR